jgi:DUF1680 family protein
VSDFGIGRIAGAALGAAVALVPSAIAEATVHSLIADRLHKGPEHERGMSNDLRSHLPCLLKYAAIEVSMIGSTLAHKIDGGDSYRPDNAAHMGAAAQAKDSWAALQHTYSISSSPDLARNFANVADWPDASWGLGQHLNAALDLAQLDGDYRGTNELMKGLSLYNDAGAYSGGPWTSKANPAYDDNAWIALDLMQAYQQTKDRSYLTRAEQMVPYFKTGLARDGGELWQVNNPNRTENTCSTAPTEQFLLMLYQATHKQEYLDMAKRMDQFLKHTLRAPNGLYYDLKWADGSKSKAIYSYNQGTPIGADVEWFRITGDRSYLADASRTANAALDHFTKGKDDRLWTHPPVFNAIFFRNLMALDKVDHNPRYRQVLSQYLERAWTHARDPKTGLFTQGGVGNYSEDPSQMALDQAAWVQMYALLAGANPQR